MPKIGIMAESDLFYEEYKIHQVKVATVQSKSMWKIRLGLQSACTCKVIDSCRFGTYIFYFAFMLRFGKKK